MKLIFQVALKRVMALVILFISLPLLLIIFLIIKITSSSSFLFKQKRAGKNKKSFILYKIQTMVIDAESLKFKIINLNEADGPVFKIKNDPRYTKFGKFLSHTGLDEIPQLINVLKGEMDFVGPRPLPIDEAKKIPKKYKKRFSVLPGMTSSWIVRGAHSLTFDQWMGLDLDYVNKKNIFYDISIFVKTIKIIIVLIFQNYKWK